MKTPNKEALNRQAEIARRWFSGRTREAEAWLEDYVHGCVDDIEEIELANHLGVSLTGLRRGVNRSLLQDGM